MELIKPIVIVLSGATFCYCIIKEILEVLYLKKVLYKTLDKSRIKSVQDFIKIKTFLNKNISYNTEFKTKKRPILRSTASQTLKSHYGFCGENARVAIKLFFLGGIKARRIYLFRKEWQHVLIEHKYHNNWYMFDGHYDPNSFLKDTDVAKIPSENFTEFPNDFPEHPYIDFCRIKLLYNIKILNSLSKIKLPSFLVYFFESPYFIKALGVSILYGLYLLLELL